MIRWRAGWRGFASAQRGYFGLRQQSTGHIEPLLDHVRRTGSGPRDKPTAQQQDIPRISLITDDQKTQWRHLLRAILRECTYLPDALAREWTAQYTMSRFRTYGFKIWEQRKNEAFPDRLLRKQHEAKLALGKLIRANQGERECLLRVLLMVHGRVGKRRHELMQPLLPVKEKTPDGDVESEESSSPEFNEKLGGQDEEATDFEEYTSNEIPKDTRSRKRMLGQSNGRRHRLDLTPQLRALLVSQMRAAPPTLTRSNPRRIDPHIPDLNSWLRPMPQKRIKNMKLKHYAQLLDRVLPPVPVEEWERLRDLASGKSAIEPFPARRSLESFNKGRNRQGSNEDALEMVVMRGMVSKKVFENRNAHTLSPRFMRRLYADVFNQCPVMDLETSTGRWNVRWGGQPLHESSVKSKDVHNADGDAVYAVHDREHAHGTTSRHLEQTTHVEN
jgi:hypothetical protein